MSDHEVTRAAQAGAENRNQKHDQQLANKIARGYWQAALQDEAKFLFVRTEAQSAFTQFVEQLGQGFFDSRPWIQHVDLNESAIEAYYPFLTMLSRFIQQQGLSAKAFCQAADLYPAQRRLFSNYLSSGSPEWAEEPIIDEILYERRQMLRSIGALLVEASKHRPLLITIGNVQNGSISLWRLLQGLHRLAPKGRFLIVASFANKAVLHHGEEQTNSWNDFMGYLDEHGVVVDIEGESLAAADESVARSPTLDALLAQARVASRFLAFEETIAWGLAAYERLQELEAPDLGLHISLLADLGDAYHHLFAADEALIYYEQMLQLAQERGDESLQVEAYRRMALACMNKHDAVTAYRYGQLAIECAARIEHEELLFKSLLALFIVEDKFTRTIEPHYYRNLNALAERWCGPNTLIYLLNMSYLYREYYDNDFQKLLDLNDTALQLAERGQNEFALAVGQHKRSIIYSQLDDNEASFESLARSESIRWRLGEKLEIVRACNGIGYLSLIRDDYENAFSYFNKAVQLFGSLRDYNEISMTLYNLASVYFRTGQYQTAMRIMDKVLQVMSILGITHIPFRDISSIYALKGICHFKVGDWIKGVECLSRINMMERSRDAETNCYIGVLSAYEASLESDIGQVNRIFEPIAEALDGSLKAHRRLLPWMLWEYASVLRKMGDEAGAWTQFERAERLADELAMPRLRQWLGADARGEAAESRVTLPEPSFDLEALVALARQEVTLKKLHHVVRNMKFLHGLQTQLTRTSDPQALAAHFIRLVMSFCPAQVVAIHLGGQKAWTLLGSVPVGGERMERASSLIEQLQSAGPAVYLDRGRPGFDRSMLSSQFNSIINLQVRRPDGFAVNLFVATEDEGLTLAKGEMQVMSIALNQLVTVLEKIKHEEKLLYLSTVDELSGLANRQALLTRLQNEIARTLRYRGPDSSKLSVAFLDLDNFKFYNDQFGHGLGDQVIREFARLLRDNVRESDYVARYGGDEFVVVLPETDEVAAATVMQRVIDGLKESEQFIVALQAFAGQILDIPHDKRLTCSVGIAGLGDLNQSNAAQDILKRADKALYDAKDSGRNQVRTWMG